MIALLTDSTCDLPPEHARQLGIHVVPLTVHLRERRLYDWQDIDPDAVYDHMKTGGMATTAPVEVEAFTRRYRDLLRTHDEVVSIHLSGKLSDTVNRARHAAQTLGVAHRVHVIDSGLASTPLAEAVLAAQRTVVAGGHAQDVNRVIEDMRSSMSAEFSVATMEYLRRGGRIGRAQELVANMLGVRPILQFSDGELKAVRRIKADVAPQDMLDKLRERFGREPISVTIAHAGRDTGRITALRTAVGSSGLNVRKGRVQLIGPVIGAHVGPGTYGFMACPVA
ncbi:MULTISPECIES: DegV family protein [Deinococcus]|uniref:DegV family protein n=1 Tax=Deinococcus rufus TaxID=2136097 RepID=A0ABV7ZFC8_9DEIO|nr:DegV family protein [Deinococcus sp. AB2017081]WQE93974.1 DegV family protein [Deinococcus sp. AB2017081]